MASVFQKPCYLCGASLRFGVLFIACIYLLGSFGLMLFCLREYSKHHHNHDPHNTHDLNEAKLDDNQDDLLTLGFFGFFNLMLYLLLWHAALKRSHNRCLIWFAISTIETGVLLVRFASIDIRYYRFEVTLFFVNLYCLWVVWAFIEELFGDFHDGDSPLPATVQQISPQLANVKASKEKPPKQVLKLETPMNGKISHTQAPQLVFPSMV